MESSHAILATTIYFAIGLVVGFILFDVVERSALVTTRTWPTDKAESPATG